MTTFADLFSEVTAKGQGFGHLEHVELTYLAVIREGRSAARSLIETGIAETARAAGVPRKFHATVTGAWFELVAYHVEDEPGAALDALVARNPALLDKNLLTRFYSEETLASEAARTAWTEPDRSPFPWAQQQPPAPGRHDV